MAEGLAERLQLDDRQVERAATATEFYARELAENSAGERRHSQQLQSAALLTAAAAYWLLLDPLRSFPLFAQASSIYAGLNRPFAFVTAICSAGRSFPEISLDLLRFRDEESQGATYHGRDSDAYQWLLRDTWNMALDLSPVDQRFRNAILEQLGDRRIWPVGRLKLPQSSYLNLIGDSVSLLDSRGLDEENMDRTVTSRQRKRDAQVSRLVSDLRSFLGRVDEQIETAMSDRYHWRRLQSAILPVEPEAVATCAVAYASVLATVGEDTGARIDTSGRIGVPLRLGAEIARRAWLGNDG